MDSNSGIIIEDETAGERFTDFTPIPCKGYNSLCKAKRYGRWWMLKGLKHPYRQQMPYRNFLKKEFDILVSLQHPNIVAASSFEEIAELGSCIVMEWIDGITLQEWIAKNADNENSRQCHKTNTAKRMADGEKIFLQLLDAVEYIHAKQIVHRDLKPSNIMITHNGRHLKLIDFGLADADSYAILKQPAGTPGYISPEQSATRIADIRNDIYSIGCILQRMQLGKAYQPVVKRCTDSIDNRYSSAEEVKEDFVKLRSQRLQSKNKIAAPVIAFCVAIAICIGFTLLYNSYKEGSNIKVAFSKHTASHNHDSINSNDCISPDASLPNKLQNLKVSQPTTAQKISEGKKTIDKMWHDTGIDTIKSVVEKSEALYRFVEKSNEYITITYPKTLGNGVDRSEKTSVISELSSYASDRYIKPTTHSLQSAE